MFKRPLAAALAAALALASAAPARAQIDNDALARILLGAIAAGIVAKAINDHGSSGSSPTTTRNVTVHKYPAPPPHHGWPHRPVYVPPAPPRPIPHAHVSRPHGRDLPHACARQVSTQYGVRTFVGRPCLEQRGVDTSRLPASCHRELDFGRRDINAWSARCLTEAGWQLR